jgi:hypothetical protein
MTYERPFESDSFKDPETGGSVFGEEAGTSSEGWKMPTIEERREALRTAALAAFDGEAGGNLPQLIASGSEYGFRDSYPDHGEVNPHALRSTLEAAAQEAQAAFKGVQKGDKEAFTRAQTDVPEALNARYATRLAEIVYPTKLERELDDYETAPNEHAEKIQQFIKEKINLATIAEVTARQLGMKVPEGFAPEKTYEVIASSLGGEEYGLKDLETFMSRQEPASEDLKEILLTDMLLRLANATWAGGQVDVAKLTEKRARLERATFDTPEGRQQQMYSAAKEKHGDEVAFYVAVFENAKDYLNLNPELKIK